MRNRGLREFESIADPSNRGSDEGWPIVGTDNRGLGSVKRGRRKAKRGGPEGEVENAQRGGRTANGGVGLVEKHLRSTWVIRDLWARVPGFLWFR